MLTHNPWIRREGRASPDSILHCMCSICGGDLLLEQLAGWLFAVVLSRVGVLASSPLACWCPVCCNSHSGFAQGNEEAV